MKVHDTGSTAHRTLERYRTGKVSKAANGNWNFKSSVKEKNLKLLNHIPVSHLGKGINFLTMLCTASHASKKTSTIHMGLHSSLPSAEHYTAHVRKKQ